MPVLAWAVLCLSACAPRALPPPEPVYQGLDGPKPIVVYLTSEPCIEIKGGGWPSRNAPGYGGYAVIDKDYVVTVHREKLFPKFDSRAQETPQSIQDVLKEIAYPFTVITYGLPPDNEYRPIFDYSDPPEPGIPREKWFRIPEEYRPVYFFKKPGWYSLFVLKNYIDKKCLTYPKEWIPPHMRQRPARQTEAARP